MMLQQVLMITIIPAHLRCSPEKKMTSVLLSLSQQYYVSLGSVAGDPDKLKQEINFLKNERGLHCAQYASKIKTCLLQSHSR